MSYKMSDNSIEDRLMNYYNCKIVKVPLGEREIKVEKKIKLGVRKILGIFPKYDYKFENSIIHFDETIEMGTRNRYFGIEIERAVVSVAYDSNNKVLYWKRLS